MCNVYYIFINKYICSLFINHVIYFVTYSIYYVIYYVTYRNQ